MPLYYTNGMATIRADKHAFVMDSGSSSSIFFKNKYQKFFIGFSKITDAHAKTRFIPIFFFPQIEIAELHFKITNIVGNYIHEIFAIDSSIKGIFGRDIIRATNWHFNLANNVIETMDIDSNIVIPKKSITFAYQNEKIPQTKVNVNGLIYEMLIDIGCNVDLCFDSLQIAEICTKNKYRNKQKDTISSTFSKDLMDGYIFDSLTIEDISYSNIHINVIQNKNIIGMKFFRRFDHLFWDSGNKKVYLWNDEE